MYKLFIVLDKKECKNWTAVLKMDWDKFVGKPFKGYCASLNKCPNRLRQHHL